jgi:uncharacterized protein YbjQ (UPF0145 family)
MRAMTLSAVLCLFANPAFATDMATSDPRIVPQSEASQCRFIDVVSEMRFAALRGAGASARAAMTGAMARARDLGADVVVVAGVTAHNNQHQVNLLAYNCSEQENAASSSSIRIVSESEVMQCRYVDIVSKMEFALRSASDTTHSAFTKAVAEAESLGGNAVVLSGITAHNNQHTVTLTVYHCER